jgi:hypothetical protein
MTFNAEQAAELARKRYGDELFTDALAERAAPEATLVQVALWAAEFNTVPSEDEMRAHIRRVFPEWAARRPVPAPKLLTCPNCGAPHLDEGQWAAGPSRTCRTCEYEWEPR